MRLPDKRSRFWPTFATVLGVAAAIALGNWQLGRGAQKRELKARYETLHAQPPIHVGAEELDPKDLDLRRAEARGVFEPKYAVLIDNRIHRGIPGYHVIMPLKLEGSDRYVLVNRGWVAAPPLRSERPNVRTPSGPLSIVGTVSVPASHAADLSAKAVEGDVWQNLTIERYRKAMPIAIQPFVLRQDSAADDGLVREWAPPDFGIEKHYGYAFQWFAIGATLLIFYAVTQFRRKPSRPA